MRILAIFCGGFTLAVCVSVWQLPQALWFPVSGGLGCLLLLLWVILRRAERTRKIITTAISGGIFGLLYILLWTNFHYTPVNALADITHEIEAVVLQRPQQTRYGYSVLVSLKTENGPNIPTVLYFSEQGKDLKIGDKIATIAHLEHTNRDSNGEEITYYTAKGILLQGSTYGELVVETPQRLPLYLMPAYVSTLLEQGVKDSFSDTREGLVMGLVMGNRDAMTDDFTSSLQRTGLSHTVAVSGMHMAFLAGMLSLLLGKNRRRTSLIMIPVVLFFMLVVGSTPSVVRASVMIIMLHIAPLFGRESDHLTSLSFALLLVLMENPYAVNHVGLQLSFGAVLGIFCCSDQITQRLMSACKLPVPRTRGRLLRGLGWFARAIICSISATLGAMVFTTPLVVFYFGSISLIAPLANLLTIWAVSFAFSGGLIVGVLSMLSPILGEGLAVVVSPFVDYLNWVIPKLGRTHFASVSVDSIFFILWLIIVYLIVFFVWRAKEKIPMWVPVSGIVATLACAIIFQTIQFRIGSMLVTVLDVGQGQSVLLRIEDKLVLVDCGGSDGDTAGELAADAIASSGQTKLDYLILTHFHADHAGGVPQLLKRISPEEMILPFIGDDIENPLKDEVLALAKAQDISVRLLSEGYNIPIGEGASIQIIPPLGDADENERGLTILASVDDFDILITGDMGAEVEQLLIDNTQLPRVELFVAGHHGSNHSNSQALLDVIKPEIAVISSAQNNRYGHPGADTLWRLTQSGAKIYRTDYMGTVTIRVA